MRQNVADRYSHLLKNVLPTPEVKEYNTSVWAQYSIRVQSRDHVQEKLKKVGVPTAVHYPSPLHLQECFNYLGYSLGDFPESEKVSKEIMSLPMNPYLTEEQQLYIINALKNII